MSNRRYDDAIASVRPELEALLHAEPVEPSRGDETAEMASWVALCLSAFGEVSEEAAVNGDDEMARAADSRAAMLSAARGALDALHAVCGIEREQALSMLEDVLAAGSELDPVDRDSPPSADAELEAAREAAVYQLSLAGQAAAELPDAELRSEYFVKGLIGFAAVATGFARNVRRWAASGDG